jgi:hypothetical protein
MQSLAAIAGPVVAGELYDHVGHSSPYVVGSGLFVLTIGVMLLALPALQGIRESPAPEAGDRLN